MKHGREYSACVLEKRCSNYIASQVLISLLIVRPYGVAAINIESAVTPIQHFLDDEDFADNPGGERSDPRIEPHLQAEELPGAYLHIMHYQRSITDVDHKMTEFGRHCRVMLGDECKRMAGGASI